jgi:xylulokinase
MEDHILAIDLGTSRVKVVLCSTNGSIVDRAERTYTMGTGSGGKAEQSPSDWIQAVTDCTRELASSGRPNWPPCICSVTGQMHGLVLLGKDGKVLRDALICSDFRAREELEQIEAQLMTSQVIQTTGSPGLSMFPGPKLLWVQHHEPEVYARIGQILSPKDYIGYLMTGEIATDTTDASGTMLYDNRLNRWDENLCNACGASVGFLPPVLSPTTIRGKVSKEFAQRSGIPEGIPVIIGAGDLPTTVIGAGLINNREIVISLGTAGIVSRISESFQEDLLGKIFYFRHVCPGQLISMGSQPGAGFSLNWFEKQILQHSPSKSFWEDMPKFSEEKISLFFLPYLLGTGSPSMDYRSQGAFLGLSHHHTQADLKRAILEGVSFSIRQSFDLLQASPPQVERIIVCAGGSYNQTWLQILADILGAPITTLTQKDTAVLGASILGGVGMGWFSTIEEAIQQMVEFDKVIEPQKGQVIKYKEAYQRYIDYYLVLKQINDRG